MSLPIPKRFAGQSALNAGYHNANIDLYQDGNVHQDVSHTSLATALTYLGTSDSKTLVFSTQHRITASATIPTNIAPAFEKGGSLDVASGVTMTMSVPRAGRHRIFYGSGTVAFSDEGEVFPEWWGAVGDNSTDSTSAIQKAMNTGNPIVGDGSALYVTTAQLVLSTAGVLRIKNLKLRPNAAFTCLTDSSNQTASTTMTGAHRVNANSFTVTSSTGMSVGDLMEIKSNQLWPFNNDTVIVKGEFTKVAAISGTTITPATPLLCDYDTASETVTVKTYTPNQVDIDGLEIIYPTPRSAIGLGLDYLDGATSKLRNITIQGSTLTGISLQQCYGVEVTNPRLVDCYESGFGYGIQFNGCTDCHVKGGYSYRARHGVDFSGGYPSHLCSVRGMHVLGHRDEGSCVGTHGGANRSVFSGNVLIGGPIGVQVRGSNTMIHNNFFGGHTSNFVTLAGAPGISVRGNVQFLRYTSSTISANDGYFMEVQIGGNAGATEDTDLYPFSGTEFVVEDNVAFPLVDFILFNSGITKLEYWSIKNNTAIITNNSGGTNIAFLESVSAATINASSVYGPNTIRNITGTYTELRNVTVSGASVGGYLADPSGTIGLSAAVGTARTGARSDGRHALDQGIIPTWTGAHTFNALITAAGGIKVTGGSLVQGALAKQASYGLAWQGITATGGTPLYDMAYFGTSGNVIFGNTTATNEMVFIFQVTLADLILNGQVTVTDGVNFALGSSSGTKFGTATTQKLAFFNATPIVQPANTVAIDDLLVNLGLRASGGNALFSNHLIRPVQTGITASTTQTQGQGALTKDFNYITVCANANDTVTLPSAVAGMQIKVRNQGASTLQIFPASGDAIDGAAVDASTTLTAGSSVVFDAQDGTNWRT